MKNIIVGLIAVAIIGGAAYYFIFSGVGGQDPKLLLGWWKDTGDFPFFKELTDKYFCVNYSGSPDKPLCTKNFPYVVKGDRIYWDEGRGIDYKSGYFKWRILKDGSLELDAKNSKGNSYYKEPSVYTKISQPTSPAEQIK